MTVEHADDEDTLVTTPVVRAVGSVGPHGHTASEECAECERLLAEHLSETQWLAMRDLLDGGSGRRILPMSRRWLTRQGLIAVTPTTGVKAGATITDRGRRVMVMRSTKPPTRHRI